MKVSFKVLGVLIAGVAVVYYVYDFRSSRLTTARLDEIKAATARMEQASAQDKKEGENAETKPASTPDTTPTTSESTTAPPYTELAADAIPATTPNVFNVLFDTTKGKLVIECHHDWAPNGTDRFYELVKIGFFTDMRIFRVVQGFVAQFGISGDPKVSRKWEDSNIPDDSVKQSNTPGMVTFAAGGSPNSRSTQLFINYGDNSRLDSGGFAPIGKVIHGMDVANQFYAGYGESITNLQEQIQMQGNAFLDQQFPKLDSIKRAAFITFNETGSPAPEQLDQNGNRPKP